MKNKQPIWKIIYTIIAVLLVIGMNVFVVTASINNALASKTPCIDEPIENIFEGAKTLSGTITEIDESSDSYITRIKVKNEEGEHWIQAGFYNTGEYTVGTEVTVSYFPNDPSMIPSFRINKKPESITVEEAKEIESAKVKEAIKESFVEMIIPNILAIATLVSLFLIVCRAKSGKKVTIHLVVLGICILIGIYAGYYIKTETVRAKAPVIYLYNDDDTKINVKIDLDGKFTYTNPIYKKELGWTVTASPEGILTDSDGRTYDYLYWEGDVNFKPDLSQGFCIPGEDTEAFLRNSAEQLGLNSKEADFFVSYWAPRMVQNKYNVITFQTTTFDEAAKLKITPEPDVLLRVNMLYYPSDEYVEIKAQDLSEIGLPLSERHGFTAIEWGGEMLGSDQ